MRTGAFGARRPPEKDGLRRPLAAIRTRLRRSVGLAANQAGLSNATPASQAENGTPHRRGLATETDA
jgi:hypothetical protein